MRVVFSEKYTARTPGHVFRADKFGAALRLVLREGYFRKADVAAPPRPALRDLELVHTRAWARKCLRGGFTAADCARAEIKITRAVREAHLLNCGGTLLASGQALESGIGLNCGGGSHHAFSGRGAGFCLINDLAVAVRALRRDGRISRAIIIDLDAHQGDGTAAIFRGDRRTFTFSMHNAEIYPERKQRSSLDIPLRPGCRDAEYLALLGAELPRALAAAGPDLALYLAGADVYRGDKLGGLGLTMAGIRRRDALVLRECRRRGLPVAVVLGGGYAKRFADTVRVHANTLIEAAKAAAR